MQQPWAWAIIHGGKDVENRTTLWRHRGPLAIHAGARLSDRGMLTVPSIVAAERGTSPTLVGDEMRAGLVRGAIIGVVNVTDAHLAMPELRGPVLGGLIDPACCESWWAEQEYREHGTLRTRTRLVHLAVADPVALPEPIPCRGALGLWDLPEHVEEHLQAVLS